MKYIARTADGTWHFTSYFSYLDSVQHLMPPHILAFARNGDNCDLATSNSLHDAWLDQWLVEESPLRKNKRPVTIRANFLGQRHDRHIKLTYTNVHRSEIRQAAEDSIQWGHGDLLVHELCVIESGGFSHELLFANGSTFLVEFGDLLHEIVPIEKSLD